MKRVLICDDSPVDRKVIAKALEKHFDVVQAEGGDAALEALKASSIDLLLLDINMPGKDGPETLRELRNLGFQTPVVLLTAEVRTSVIKAMMVDGIKSYIVKPVSPDDLRKRVADVLGVSLDGAEEEEEPQQVEVSKQTAFSILIVDQFEMVSTRLKELLGESVKVTYAKTSMVARQYMDERNFDLVLVDTELPNVDLAGLVEALIKLKADVPIVGIYMRDVPNAFSDAMRLKLSGHVYKPFHKAELEVLYDEFLFSRDVKVTSMKGPTLTALTPIMPTQETVDKKDPEGDSEGAEGGDAASEEGSGEVELTLSEAYCVRLRAGLQSGIRQIASGSHVFGIVDLRALPEANLPEFTLLSLEQGVRLGLDTRVVMSSLDGLPNDLKERFPGGVFASIDDAITYGDEEDS